jgi:putative ABC transport system permease protein
VYHWPFHPDHLRIIYINLAVATSVKRLKEIGVRKITGAVKKELALQFFIEALLVVLAAGMIAVFIQFGLSISFYPNLSHLSLYFIIKHCCLC